MIETVLKMAKAEAGQQQFCPVSPCTVPAPTTDRPTCGCLSHRPPVLSFVYCPAGCTALYPAIFLICFLSIPPLATLPSGRPVGWSSQPAPMPALSRNRRALGCSRNSELRPEAGRLSSSSRWSRPLTGDAPVWPHRLHALPRVLKCKK